MAAAAAVATEQLKAAAEGKKRKSPRSLALSLYSAQKRADERGARARVPRKERIELQQLLPTASMTARFD